LKPETRKDYVIEKRGASKNGPDFAAAQHIRTRRSIAVHCKSISQTPVLYFEQIELGSSTPKTQ
jgi:hypothetical protein